MYNDSIQSQYNNNEPNAIRVFIIDFCNRCQRVPFLAHYIIISKRNINTISVQSDRACSVREHGLTSKNRDAYEKKINIYIRFIIRAFQTFVVSRKYTLKLLINVVRCDANIICRYISQSTLHTELQNESGEWTTFFRDIFFSKYPFSRISRTRYGRRFRRAPHTQDV